MVLTIGTEGQGYPILFHYYTHIFINEGRVNILQIVLRKQKLFCD